MNLAVRTSLVLFAALAIDACAPRHSMRWNAVYFARPGIAARAFDEGVASFDRGEFARALASFDTAQRTEPHPVVLFNLARVHEVMGHDTAAARAYTTFLADPGDADSSLVTTAREALWRLRPRIAWLRVRAPAGALVGDQVLAPSYDEQLVPIDPGIRVVRIGERNVIAVRARAGDVFLLDGAQTEGPIMVAAVEFDPGPFTTRSTPTTTAQRQP